ncbi:MAG: bifunctional ornithine acetyltransferase/N-acetylglutamate synthase [Kouleothrix sp.]
MSGGLKRCARATWRWCTRRSRAGVAAVFTTNMILAAPVFFNQAILSRNRENIRAVLINAGQANAGTGQQGLADAIECAKLTADELEVVRDSVLLMSTGQIGVPLPMPRMRDAIRRAVSELDSGGGRRAALAILTADTRPKDRALVVSLREGRRRHDRRHGQFGGRLAGPRMGTMLAVLADVAIDTRLLARSLEQSVAQSFGRLALDGHASPNDNVVLLANGAAENTPIIDASSWEYGAWQEALDALCADLAQQVLRDAATSGKTIRSMCAAPQASRCAPGSRRHHAPSVRWACAQSVPDWGGMLVAVGASGADLRPDLLELRLGAVPVMLEGIRALRAGRSRAGDLGARG